MSTFWKVIVGLAMVLPITAYVAGSLAASSAEQKVDRSPVVIADRSSEPSPEPGTGEPRDGDPNRPPKQAEPSEEQSGDDGDAGGGDDSTAPPVTHTNPNTTAPKPKKATGPGKGGAKKSRGTVDDNGVTVVTPKPTRVDDDTRDQDDTEDDTDDTDD